MRPAHSPAPAASSGAARDARDLRRGALLNVLSYAARLPHPILLAVVTQAYGASRWGVYIAAQSAAYVAVRICLMGLDRAMVYWIPRSLATADAIPGFKAAARRVVITGAVTVALGACLGAPWLARMWRLANATPLAIMALGVLPLALTEFFVNATIGRRRMEAQVGVRDVLVPLSMVGGAVALYAMGWRETGLAWAFVCSHTLGAIAAIYVFRRMFRDVRLHADHEPLPPDLRRYARPVWAAELSNTLLRRLDPMVLAVFADPFTVGVYGVVLQFANTVSSLRGAFDSLVTAMVADISAGGQQMARARQRLRHGFSDATSLVIMTQLPVIAFFITFGSWLLSLFGDGFEQGYGALALFCAFWGVHGLAGLAGNVINGVGSSRATLLASLFTLIMELLLLWLLTPRWGLEGAVLAVGAAWLGQGLMHIAQVRWITGTFAYTSRVGWTLAWALGCLFILSAVQWGLAWILTPASARIIAFAVFLCPVAGGVYQLWRTRPAMPADQGSAAASGGAP